MALVLGRGGLVLRVVLLVVVGLGVVVVVGFRVVLVVLVVLGLLVVVVLLSLLPESGNTSVRLREITARRTKGDKNKNRICSKTCGS